MVAVAFADAQACLDGARDILSEQWAEDATLVGKLREWLWTNGLFESKGGGRQGEGRRQFRDYFDYAEPIGKGAFASRAGGVPRLAG